MSSWASPGGVPATPAVLVDEARLDQNLRAMAGRAAGRGLTLRPHAKTHKSVEIARRQLGHGAAGISVATLKKVGHRPLLQGVILWLLISSGSLWLIRIGWIAL